jgi:iron-sulfur cluster assembly accessory protein
MSFDLKINQTAIDKIKSVIQNHSSDTFLRIEINSGGCSGFNTTFKLDNLILEDDIIINQDNIKVVINKDIANLIEAGELNFNSSIMNSYFSLDVKKAKDKCSCGSSFSL